MGLAWLSLRNRCVDVHSMRLFRTNRNSQRRRYLSGVLLLAYLGAAFGFPMPTASAKVSSPSAAAESKICCCSNTNSCCCCSRSKASGTGSGSVEKRLARGSCCERRPDSASGSRKCCSSKGQHGTCCSGLVRWSAPRCPCEKLLWVIHATVLPPAPPCWSPNVAVVDIVSYPPLVQYFMSLAPPVPPPRAWA